MERAYSILNVKDASEDARGLTIKGIASTPTPDLVGDSMDPMGAQFKLPMPLLWGHDSNQTAVGRVEFAKPNSKGIPFEAFLPYIKEPGRLKDRIDEVIHAVKYRLVTAVSIGFKGLEREMNKKGGWNYKLWNMLELSLVNIPANAEATITTIKALSSASRPALSGASVVSLSSPAVAESSKANTLKANAMSQESLSAAEKRREDLAVEHQVAMQEVEKKGTTLDEDDQAQVEKRLTDIESLDRYIDLQKRSVAVLTKARPIGDQRPHDDVSKNVGYITVKQNKEPGIAFAQAMRCIYKAGGVEYIAAEVAKKMYRDDPSIEMMFKTAVEAGGTVSGNWGAGFMTQEGGPFQEFLEFMRPQTIIGRIPGTTSVEFYKPIGVQTGGGAGYWVGEGKAKPLTKFAATPTSIPPTKVANIVAVTEEWLRHPSANNDRRIRDSMAGALIQRMDVDFVDPSKTLDAGISPASITNGAATQAATGAGDYGDIIVDLKYMMGVLNENDTMTTPVLIVDRVTAMGLSLMVNAMGARVFPNVTLTGGTFEFGIPIIVSNAVPHTTGGDGTAIMVNAKEILIADEGGFDIQMSRDASLEMNDDAGSLDGDSLTPTPASLVSMFQTDSVAFRAHRYVGWLRAKLASVVYVTSVNWGNV